MVSIPGTLSGDIAEEVAEFTLDDLCRACSVNAEWLISLVDEGILDPVEPDQTRWQFTGVHLRRARIVLRLQRDLSVNLAGAAVALELMDEVETLRARLAVLERQD